MRTHVQDRWTRSPSVFLHLTVEETQQLASGLSKLQLQDRLTPNELAAVSDLWGNLQAAVQAERPQGIRGMDP